MSRRLSRQLSRQLCRAGTLTFAAGLVALSMTGTAGAGAATAPAYDPGGSGSFSAADQQHAVGYWTPDRMRQAVPVDQLFVPKRQRSLPVPAGSPQVVAPTAADPGTVTPLAFPNGGSAWTGGGAVTRTGGRVFFTFQGRNASCSGDAVTSGNRSVVMTAGHCVKLQGAFHTNWVFAPGYDNGNAPFGTWAARQTLATPQWVASEDINFDVGAAVVNQLNGQSLTDVVGGQGIAFNQARGQNMYAFGYPAAAPYDGTRLIYCSGRVFNDFLLSRGIGMTCNMTGGSSGGPWFLQFNESTGTGIQNSVNSFKYNFFPNWMFGPYFGTDAQNLYNTAQAA